MYEIFAELLKKKGITAHTVSLATGITSATFSSWKKGIYTPKREKMQKIADYLGVTVDYLMGIDSSTPPPPQYSPVDKLIIHEMLKLDDVSKRRVLEFIQFLLYQNFNEKNKKPPQE